MPAVLLECRPGGGSTESPYTVLVSHGNAEDLGQMMPMLRVIRDYCHVNVMAYDYEGYGLHKGCPSEEKTYRDVSAAFNFLTQQRKFPADRIILFGRSLGTGPTVHLASRLFSGAGISGASAGSTANNGGCAAMPFSPTRYCSIRKNPKAEAKAPPQYPAGVILQSPLTSVVGIVSHYASRVMPGDMFQNISKIDQVRSPVLIMHGTEDRIVPFSHGQALSDRAPDLYRFLVLKGAGHNDMEERFTNDYLSSVMQFISHCDARRRERLAAGPAEGLRA
eukprot:TRINITY_DN1781_c0_g1_i1.p1 TRINITY_DN1781_c0_g1~~TRINITY_DN1781_c0_g1_i1.p1  ORF type:complete len:278 (+),score=39.43 TRINITY_DN1781_c0_g1_i1:127-960(+)